MQYCTDFGSRQGLTNWHGSDLKGNLLHITQRFTCHALCGAPHNS